MTHQAPNPGDPAYDPADPHGFHHDAKGHPTHGHHVSGWKLLVGVLGALLFFTLLTVNVADIEVWLTTHTEIPITQLWNVIIAMSIATVKAMLVCMYFMHLRHDSPLNTFIVLFTILTLGLFLTFPALDIGNLGQLNPFKAQVGTVGGTGAMQSRLDGTPLTGPIVAQARREAIDAKASALATKHGHSEITDADRAEAAEYIWFHLYDAKAEHSHGKPVHATFDDAPDLEGLTWHARWIAAGGPAREHGEHGEGHADALHAGPDPADANTPERARPRSGLTPGLFADAAAGHHADGQHDSHGDHEPSKQRVEQGAEPHPTPTRDH